MVGLLVRALGQARVNRWLCGILGLASLHASAAEVDFDFEKAELRSVIQAVAELTGRNFLVDPRVKGKVTVVAPTPLKAGEAYQVFQSILEVNGYTTVKGDGVTKIVPEKGSKHRALDLGKAAGKDALVTRVIRLEHVSAQRLVPILRPLVAPYGHLVAYPDTPSLILTDRAGNVERLAAIVARLDRPSETGEVTSISLVHASADKLAELLGRLYSGEQNTDQEGGPGVEVLADPRTNSLIVRADQATREEIEALVKDLDTPTGTTGNTHVIYLENASAKEIVDVLKSTVSKDQNQKGESSDAGLTIKADPQTNALVVRASRSRFETIKQVVEKLDVRRLQVYVEALIVEISTDMAREFGIQWQTAEGLKGDNQGAVGGTNFTVGDSIQQAAQDPLALGAGLSLGLVDGTLTLPDGTEVTNLAGLVRALESQSDANVLSTPNLLTMDNEEAEIVVGQNVPFVTGSFSQVGDGTAVQNPFQTIQREDVGLKLRLTPQITEGDAIKMDIYQEVSSVVNEAQGQAQDIVTQKRSLQTTVSIQDQKMVVLGGLIEDRINKNVQEVPILGRIPLLGALFRYQRKTHEKINLMVFLRPRIIRGPEGMAQPTRRKYDFIEGLQKRQGINPEDGEAPPLERWDRITPQGGSSGP